MKNKFITWSILIIFLFVSLLLPFPAPTSTVNAEDTSSLRVINTTAPTPTGFSFKKDLMPGDTDPDVKQLQLVLNSSADTMVANSGTGSPGQESTYFGGLTKSAVIKFQEKYRDTILTPVGLTSGNGIVGKSTRTQLNLLIGVTVTTDSVGLPQSRSGSTPTASPVSSATVTTSSNDTCQFVEMLISIGVIQAKDAAAARSALGCPAKTTTPTVIVTPTAPVVSAPASSMSTCQFIEFLISIQVVIPSLVNQARSVFGCPVPVNVPSLDLKANNSDGPITVAPGSTFTLSWQSSNTTYCSDGLNKLPTSGSAKLVANTSLSYPMTCTSASGSSVTDSVVVKVSNNSTTDNWTSDPSRSQSTTGSNIVVLGSNITPGYNYADIQVTTNVSTGLAMTYTSTPSDSSSVKTYQSSTVSTVHSDRLTGLTPNSTYYVDIGLVDETGIAIYNEFVFTTLSSPTSNSPTTDSSGQKVLSSPSGTGIVAVPESSSLATKNKVTLEAWVNPTSWSASPGISNTSDSVIISKGNIGANIDYAFTLDNGKLVYSNSDASLWTCSPVVPLNKWTHVAVSVDESAQNISLYVNGVKQTSICEGSRGVFSKSSKINKANAITEATVSSSTANTSSYLGTGSNIYFANFYPADCSAADTEGNGFIGLIDDVKIWNIALSGSQISADAVPVVATSTSSMMPTYNTQPTGLVGHWTFDDGYITDLTYYLNNGVIKGDIQIVDDPSAKSAITLPAYSSSSAGFTFPESCDANIADVAAAATSTALAGYQINFKGGVKSVSAVGPSQQVTLETCDNPREDLVKSVSVIGDAPPKDPSFYNNMGTIIVTIAAGLGIQIPKERDTIQGTAINYTSQPSNPTVAPVPTSSSANYAGTASNWTPVSKSCMKPLDSGGLLGGSTGTWAIVGAVALVTVVVFCTACVAALPSMLTTVTPGLAAGGFMAADSVALSTVGYVAVAGAGYVGGSLVSCDAKTPGCF